MRDYFKILIAAFVLCIFVSLRAERLSFSIDYLGFSVATVDMFLGSDDDIEHKITVTSRSSRFIDFFTHSFENTYVVYADSLFRPKLYLKDINQRNFQEKAEIIYSFETSEAMFYDSISERSLKYHVLEDTRDFFSALYYLRTLNLKENQTLSLDVAGKIVLISSIFTKAEFIRTSIGGFDANRVEISFKWLDDTRKMRSDILTNNLWLEENKLIFWFTDDERQIPIKSQYVMKPFNVNWSIKSFENPS